MTDERYQIAARLADREDLERIFIEADKAKCLLRQAGFGWTGLGILETAQQVVLSKEFFASR